MVRDRLAELKKRVKLPDCNDDEEDDPAGSDKKGKSEEKEALTTFVKNGEVRINMGGVDDQLGAFLDKVADLKKLIDELRNDVDKVKVLHSDILSAFHTDKKKERKTELEDLTATIKFNSQDIRKKLKDMAKSIENSASGRKKSESSNSATSRIESTQHTALHHAFTDILSQYQNAQVEYMNRCKEKIMLDLEITNSNVTVEEVLEQENFTVFTSGLNIQSEEQAKNALYQARALRDDILKIEKSLVEVHAMFSEMAILVQGQGETIDRIETHVTEAAEYAEQGRDQLDKAEKTQAAARKKKIWIYIILAILALICILIIYLAF